MRPHHSHRARHAARRIPDDSGRARRHRDRVAALGENISACGCSELPNVQQDIAWQISEALRLKLTGEQKKKLRKRASVNPEAYQEYLRGRHFFNAWSPDGFRKALEHFERAIELDPAYAPAYAGLGDVIGCMWYYGLISPRDGFPRARAAAEKAIALDADLADAYGTLALGSLFRRPTGRKPRGSSGARSRSIPSSPASAPSTPSCSLHARPA